MLTHSHCLTFCNTVIITDRHEDTITNHHTSATTFYTHLHTIWPIDKKHAATSNMCVLTLTLQYKKTACMSMNYKNIQYIFMSLSHLLFCMAKAHTHFSVLSGYKGK